MKIIIDGYNCIGLMKGMSLSDKEKESKFIAYLQRHRPKNVHFVVVFDSHDPENKFGHKTLYQGITVIDAPSDETADHVIIRMMKESRQCKVVSSDKEILAAAKSCRVDAMTVDAFSNSLKTSVSAQNEKPSPSAQDIEFWMDEMSSD